MSPVVAAAVVSVAPAVYPTSISPAVYEGVVGRTHGDQTTHVASCLEKSVRAVWVISGATRVRRTTQWEVKTGRSLLHAFNQQELSSLHAATRLAC